VIWRYENVPGFGSVVLSHHAQRKAAEQRINDATVEKVLFKGRDRPDGEATWREHTEVRLVIIRPTPWRGEWLVKTMFRVQAQAKARPR